MEKEKKLNLFINLDAFILVLILLSLILIKYEIVLIVVGIISTIPVVINALIAIRNRKVSIDLLASIALVVSLIEREWISVAFINLMITSARMFARYVEIKSHSALQSLIKAKPTIATIETKDGVIDIPVENIKVGDLVVVELGEKVSVDGTIEKGEALIDQSSLTGESIPVLRKKGDKALSFTTIVSGNITIRVEKVGQETTFEKIVKLIEKSQSNKAKIQSLGDTFSKWYIIITLSLAVIIYFYTGNIGLVLSLLLVSCADDIAVAIPLALATAITHSAKHGAIVKGGNFIEGFSKIKVMIFDKTGTLTTGKLKVEKVFAFDGNTEEEIISLAGTASLLSHHPVSHAIAEFAKSKNAYTPEPENLEELMGKGIIATKNNEKIISGKLDFFRELGIEINKEEMYIIDQEMEKGLNITLIGKNNKAVGFLALGDTIRPNLKNIIADLKKLGIKKTVMLTGDNEKIAEKIAKEIGIDEYYANLLPEQKTAHLERYLSKDYKVAMVGDGVNDAPCISMADIGIAMGVIGSDSAIESADIAIMRDDLSQIPEMMRISKKTLTVIKQDLIFWAVINIIGFYLVFSGFLDPAGAAAYNFTTDFIPIINSLRLFR